MTNMSGELTVAVTLAITLGTAAYVAWPLIAAGTRPEEFFEPEPAHPAPQRFRIPRKATAAPGGSDAASALGPAEKHPSATNRTSTLNLDIEQEILDFRRRSKEHEEGR